MEAKELTFDQLYRDKYGMELFQRFVKDNYLEENILFLAATQAYRDMCSNPANTPTQCLASALLICATYIRQGAEVQVNVGSSLSSSVLAQFEDPKSAVRSKPLTGNEFQEVEQEATMLIQTNAFPRFKQSEHWDHWITYRHFVENAKKKHAVAEPVEEETLDSPALSEQKSSDGEGNLEFKPVVSDRTPSSELKESRKDARLEEVKQEETSEQILDRVLPADVSHKPIQALPSSQHHKGYYATLPMPPRSTPPPHLPSKPSWDDEVPVVKTPTAKPPPSAKLPEAADAPPPTSDGALPPPSANEEIYFKRKSPNKGISYYINVASKQTTWKIPETGIIYSCLLDDAGRAYFVNVREKTSTWDTPDCLKDFVEVYKII